MMLSPPTSMQDALQAAGHPGCQQGNGIFVKPCVQQEVDFYQQLLEKNSPLLDVVPVFMGTLVAGGAASQEIDQISHPTVGAAPLKGPGENDSCIVLRDELAGYAHPSLADIKLGFQLWDETAKPSKRQRLDEVAKNTTSGSLAFRIAGMSVVQPDGSRRQYDKQFGREPSAENVNEYLAHLFPQIENEYVQAVVESIIERLDFVIECLLLEPTKMHSCSILVVYEGDLAELKAKVEGQDDLTPKNERVLNDSDDDDDDDDEGADPSAIVSVKLIDFAHSVLATKPDHEVIQGLTNLKESLQQISSKSSSK